MRRSASYQKMPLSRLGWNPLLAEQRKRAHWEGPHALDLRRRGGEGEALVGQSAEVGHMLADEDAGPEQCRMHRSAPGPRVVDIVAVDADQRRPAVDQQLRGLGG